MVIARIESYVTAERYIEEGLRMDHTAAYLEVPIDRVDACLRYYVAASPGAPIWSGSATTSSLPAPRQGELP